jgi:hypothetical protein
VVVTLQPVAFVAGTHFPFVGGDVTLTVGTLVLDTDLLFASSILVTITMPASAHFVSLHKLARNRVTATVTRDALPSLDIVQGVGILTAARYLLVFYVVTAYSLIFVSADSPHAVVDDFAEGSACARLTFAEEVISTVHALASVFADSILIAGVFALSVHRIVLVVRVGTLADSLFQFDIESAPGSPFALVDHLHAIVHNLAQVS